MPRQSNKETYVRVALISCSKTKRPGRHSAFLLYNSELFRRTYWYVTNKCHYDLVIILSAQYGAIEPFEEISSYDKTLHMMKPQERRLWGVLTAIQIQKKVPSGSEISLYCGRLYRVHLIPCLHAMRYKIPLAHMGIGQQLQWYARQGYSLKAVS